MNTLKICSILHQWRNENFLFAQNNNLSAPYCTNGENKTFYSLIIINVRLLHAAPSLPPACAKAVKSCKRQFIKLIQNCTKCTTPTINIFYRVIYINIMSEKLLSRETMEHMEQI